MLLTNAYDPDPRVRQEALALIRMGCEVKLLAWDRDLKSPEFECMEGVQVERVFLRSTHGRGNTQLFFYASLYHRIFWRGWKTRFDVLHCHDLDTLPLGVLLAKLRRKPLVYDAHESFPDMLQDSVSDRIRRGLVKLEDFLIRRVDLLITVGEKLRRHFEARGAKHSVVVGNWKRLTEFAVTDDERQGIRQRLGIPNSATVVVNITQLLKDRKIEELLEAADGCSDVYVIIGGKGILEGMVKERAARNPRIVYVGFVTGSHIPAYTCAADAVYYGFDPENPNARFSAPNKLFEALAAGRPLITGDFGEIADVVRKGQCGVVLPSYSAEEVRKAIQTLSETGQRQRFATNAKRIGQSMMNWERGEEVLRREYSKLLALDLRGPVPSTSQAQREESGPAAIHETPCQSESYT
jgi:glycosyltransferase involved in cell wall biosynthesis